MLWIIPCPIQAPLAPETRDSHIGEDTARARCIHILKALAVALEIARRVTEFARRPCGVSRREAGVLNPIVVVDPGVGLWLICPPQRERARWSARIKDGQRK